MACVFNGEFDMVGNGGGRVAFMKEGGRAWGLAAVALLFLLGSFGTWGYGPMGFGMGFGFLFMIVFWGAAAWLAFVLFNSARVSKKAGGPVAILKERYASGEISGKQYAVMKKELE